MGNARVSNYGADCKNRGKALQRSGGGKSNESKAGNRRLYFDVIAEGTLCEGAEVEIVHVKPKLKCPSCGCLFEKKMMSFACPQCGTDGEPTDIGKEFYIDSIEVE